MTALSYDVVIPTVGRPALRRLLEALLAGGGPEPENVFVVDDRRGLRSELGPLPGCEAACVLGSAGRGPAAARNVGWRAGRAEWVAFLDDDVIPERGWREKLVGDLAELPRAVGASQGRLSVPLGRTTPPTDWERNVAGLESARWATADMAYRRMALAAVGGFDERFTRAYREDADLGARVVRAGWTIVDGKRRSAHPAGAADRWVSVRLQAGNADDVLLRAVHGRHWRRVTGAPAGRRRRHLAVVASAAVALTALATARRRLAVLGATGWAVGTAELAWSRIAPGPRTAGEMATMVTTSVAIPFAATGHWLRGWARLPRHLRSAQRRRPWPTAVLFDRDGTLVEDVPYNGDPAGVVPMPGAREALDRLRSAGVSTGVVSNQSGVARRMITAEQVHAVNRRVEEMLGPLGPWCMCFHSPEDGCACRKPAAGLVHRAAAALGLDPRDMAVVGDIGADVDAARRAGARAILVPNGRTRLEEVLRAPEVAQDLVRAVDALMAGAS